MRKCFVLSYEKEGKLVFQLNYGLHMMTKWFNKKTSCKMSLESKPGDVLPTVFRGMIKNEIKKNKVK